MRRLVNDQSNFTDCGLVLPDAETDLSVKHLRDLWLKWWWDGYNSLRFILCFLSLIFFHVFCPNKLLINNDNSISSFLLLILFFLERNAIYEEFFNCKYCFCYYFIIIFIFGMIITCFIIVVFVTIKPHYFCSIGPMVWYQYFEYALGHWMQKSTEHVIGCVLCSPGCFSLFRGIALMEDNVMARYTTKPTEPRHHIQYDQGASYRQMPLVLILENS